MSALHAHAVKVADEDWNNLKALATAKQLNVNQLINHLLQKELETNGYSWTGGYEKRGRPRKQKATSL